MTNLASGLTLFILCLISLTQTSGLAAGVRGAMDEYNSLIYLPIVPAPDNFDSTPAVWSAGNDPGNNQVVLFRQQFQSSSEALSHKLEIFADTRYEAWLDGVWLGRGPARFSRTLHEYDVYELDSLEPGEHTLAALVQWAPNIRRSESTRPYLQARFWEKTATNWRLLTETDPAWKTQISTAWNPQSVPVHRWGLIGPTELLDLNLLPGNWFQTWFNDNNWEQAVLVSPVEMTQGLMLTWYEQTIPEDPTYQEATTINIPAADTLTPRFRPRTILPLSLRSIGMEVIDTGDLGTGYDIRELLGETGEPYVLQIISDDQESITLQTVSVGTAPDPELIQINGSSLTWTPFHSQLEDLYQTEVTLLSGSNQLEIASMPSEGLTLGISQGAGNYASLPLIQGVNAGRRLLLAEPFSNPGTVEIQGESPLSAIFNNLPGYLLLDLGRVVHGRIAFNVSGPMGSIVDVGWDERLLPGSQRALPYPGSLHPEWNQTDSWILDGSPRPVTTLDARAGRYVLIAAWGSGPISLTDIQVWEETYPLIQEGSFQSDDQLLNDIWQVGADTLRMNMLDAYTDTPWRERGQWWGDAYVESQINRVTFGDEDLLPRGITFLASANPDGSITGMQPNGQGLSILDYGMLWVQSLHETVFIDNQREYLYDYIEVLQDFMHFCEGYINPETGLLDIPNLHWSKSAYIDTLGHHDRYGQSTTINSLYYDTLRRAARLASTAGYLAQANHWHQQAVSLRENIHAYLYLPAEQAYAASIYADSVITPTVLSQAWPLAYGIVPEDLSEPVARHMLDLLGSDPSESPIGTYGFHWVLQALGRQGKIDDALELIRTFYGYMLDRGATSWWEWFEADQHYANSLSHGWAGSPTWFLSTYVLGLQQQDSTTWSLTIPDTQEVNFIQGKLPFQDGQPVEAIWERQGCGIYWISIHAPAASQGWLSFPGKAISQVMDVTDLEQPVVTANNSSQELYSVPLKTGNFLVTLADACSSE